jgi:hypothetical protein
MHYSQISTYGKYAGLFFSRSVTNHDYKITRFYYVVFIGVLLLQCLNYLSLSFLRTKQTQTLY